MMGVGFLLIAGIIFEAGVLVGLHKGGFSGQVGDNYERTFGPRSGEPGMGLPNPHGAFGKIVTVTLPTFTVENDGMPEEIVRVASDTIVRNGRDTVDASKLTVGSYVIVLGAPSNAGDVDAKLIRIVPPPPDAVGSTTTN